MIQRLALEDPLLAAIADPTGEELQEAVKRFQARHDLKVDGRVTAPTLAALNVPVSRRIKQIAANMQRWRWLPRTFEDRYIAVNVPDQSMEFIRDGVATLSSRAVVGRMATPTPILYTTVLAVVVNPPWQIRGDIVVNQVLPKLRRNSSYLASRNMVLVNGPANDPQGTNIDWRKVSATEFPYQVVQLPGPNNGLGSLMLDSPNDFDIYLHDTPGKALFKSSERAVSNGCVRVEAILQLASLVLGGEGEAERVTEGISAGDTQRLSLDTPVPVYFLYWTAIATPDGTVGFRRDLYGRDVLLITALAKPSAERSDLVSVATSSGLDPVDESEPLSEMSWLAEIDPSADTELGAEIAPIAEGGASTETEFVEPTEPGHQPTKGETFATTEPLAVTEGTTATTRYTGARWPEPPGSSRSTRVTPETEGLFPMIKRLMKSNWPPCPARDSLFESAQSEIRSVMKAGRRTLVGVKSLIAFLEPAEEARTEGLG